MPGVDEQHYQPDASTLNRRSIVNFMIFIHPAHVGPGLASWVASFVLVSGLC